MKQGTNIEPESLKQWQDKYRKCLALEFNDPNYFEVHHMMVLTYMLQTDGYSDACFTTAKEILGLFLKGSITPNEVLKEYENLEKAHNIENRFGSRNPQKYRWNMDILDIRTKGPELYGKDIRAWANDVLTIIETQHGEPSKNGSQPIKIPQSLCKSK